MHALSFHVTRCWSACHRRGLVAVSDAGFSAVDVRSRVLISQMHTSRRTPQCSCSLQMIVAVLCVAMSVCENRHAAGDYLPVAQIQKLPSPRMPNGLATHYRSCHVISCCWLVVTIGVGLTAARDMCRAAPFLAVT